jgi:arylsulfatase A-like enzyme
VGDVLTELERQGLDDNTFVVFMSDNGRPFPRCKTTLTLDGVRTPFIVRYPPLVDPGTMCDSVLSVIDLAPTVLNMAGLPLGESFQGIDFTPLLKNPLSSTRQYAYSEHNWHDYRAYERAVHSKTHTYIRNWLPDLPRTPPADAVTSMTFKAMLELKAAGQLPPYQDQCFLTPRPAEELFDSRADPHSLLNLAGTPNHKETLEQMQYLMDIWRDEYQDDPAEDLTPDGFDRTSGKRLPNNLKNGQIQKNKNKGKAKS